MKEQKILENIPDSGTWPSYNQVDENGDYSHRVTVIRSIADIETIVELRKQIAELEATIDYMEITHNQIVEAILDLDEMEQDSEEMANAEQDLLELAKSSKVYGVPSEYRDISGEKRIVELEQNLGLLKISLDHQKTLLVSCEAALSQRDAKITELEKEIKQNTLQFVGYTNGNQIAYAKEDEGAFYPKTLNNCYIPLYMLNVHLHRLSGTMSESWMSDLQAEQLREGVTNGMP